MASNTSDFNFNKSLQGMKTETIILSSIWLPLFVLGFIGNVLVTLTVLKTKTFHLPIYYLLASMAVSDAISTLSSIAYLLFQLLYAYLDMPLAIKTWTCQFNLVIIYLSYYTSTHTLTFLSVDRYYAIVHNYQVLKNSRKTKLVIIATWALGLGISIPMIEISGVSPLFPFICDYIYISTVFGRIYISILFLTEVIIPFIIMTYYYIRTYRYMKQQVKEISSICDNDKVEKQKKDAMKMLVTVTVVFISFSFLFHITKMVMAITARTMIDVYLYDIPNVYLYGDGLGVLLNLINPILYCLSSRSFREAMLNAVRVKVTRNDIVRSITI
ncbi:Neuromedin-U receptor 2 [Trichoplax sp. H2]|nr:Neuromedin-U receptor 2 [Trichoplax sp. H2]|eukprot:RDD36702.1 Neuromedin-U receptor 2 [Trichoplax sp. H2]